MRGIISAFRGFVNVSPSTASNHMQVEIWSDVVCPWCYIGKRRFEQALATFEHADEVDVVWRSFELDPSAPATVDIDLIERLASKYGVSREQALAMNARVSGIA